MSVASTQMAWFTSTIMILEECQPPPKAGGNIPPEFTPSHNLIATNKATSFRTFPNILNVVCHVTYQT